MLALLGGGAGVASAQGDGVVVDPDSPAGKEYALPLDSARRDAAGGGSSGARGGDAPALFGAGISPRASGQSGGGRDNGGSPDETSPKESGGGGAGGVGGAEASRAVAQAVAESGSGMSAGVLTTLIALGVLIVGGAVGLSVRSLRGRDQPH